MTARATPGRGVVDSLSRVFADVFVRPSNRIPKKETRLRAANDALDPQGAVKMSEALTKRPSVLL